MALGNTDLVRSWVTVHISGVESWLRRAGTLVDGLEGPGTDLSHRILRVGSSPQ